MIGNVIFAAQLNAVGPVVAAQLVWRCLQDVVFPHQRVKLGKDAPTEYLRVRRGLGYAELEVLAVGIFAAPGGISQGAHVTGKRSPLARSRIQVLAGVGHVALAARRTVKPCIHTPIDAAIVGVDVVSGQFQTEVFGDIKYERAVQREVLLDTEGFAVLEIEISGILLVAGIESYSYGVGDRTSYAEADDVFLVLGWRILQRYICFPFVPGKPGNVVDGAREGVAPEVGGLRALDDFHTLHVRDRQEAAAGRNVRTVPEQCAHLGRWRNDLLIHAAEADLRIHASGRGRDAVIVQTGNKFRQLMEIADAGLFQLVLRKCRHRDRNFVDIFFPFPGGNYDFLQ